MIYTLKRKVLDPFSEGRQTNLDISWNCNFFPFSFILEHGVRNKVTILSARPRGYKTAFVLTSAEHEIFFAIKCENANNSWHVHIY